MAIRHRQAPMRFPTLPRLLPLLLGALLLFPSVGCSQAGEGGLFAHRKTYKALEAKLQEIDRLASASPGRLALGPGDYVRHLEFGGRTRRYVIHVPPGYSTGRPWPLVINFHGGGGFAHAARVQSNMDQKADQAGFLAVYPDGTGLLDSRGLTWNAGQCCGYAVDNNIDDVGFTRFMLSDLSRLFAVDHNRIYATGLSNGAFMSYRVACELSDQIAAIAPIAGVMTVDSCRPRRPVPVIHFHGTEDEFSPYHGGVGKKSFSKVNYRSAPQTVSEWLRFNNIAPTPASQARMNGATVTSYRNPMGAEVVLVTLEGMGHTWPGGTRLLPKKYVGGLAGSVDANDMMWDFFQRHPLNAGPRY